jgi:hypothetical protein
LALENELKNNESIQCITGHGYADFGSTQTPSVYDFADGVDTMQFLSTL